MEIKFLYVIANWIGAFHKINADNDRINDDDDDATVADDNIVARFPFIADEQ